MFAPLLLFRVPYLPSYDGAGTVTGHDAYINNYEFGEAWNFRVEGGRCYGYVMMSGQFAGIDLSRIDATRTWARNDEFDGIDVVFIAEKPHAGQLVVGWYQGATVFHKAYRKCRVKNRLDVWEQRHYFCHLDAKRAVLLPEESRIFKVPNASMDGKGFPGMSNVWYPNADKTETSSFISQLHKYIGEPSAQFICGRKSLWRD